MRGFSPKKINECKKILVKIFNGISGIFKKNTKVTVNVVKLSENELLKGRCAIITGATGGICYSIADAMLNAGATVVITGRTEERCKKAVEQLEIIDGSRKGRVFYQVMDVRQVDKFDEAFVEIKTKVFPLKIDILCNNAGVQGARFGDAIEEEFDNVMDTNYKGVFFLSQLISKYMIDNGIKGNILNIASVSSDRHTNGAYALSKACMKEMTLGLAKFLIPYNIVVNGIAPGPTATPMMNKNESSSIYHQSNPSKRYAMPEEIGNMAVVLTSDMK